MINNLTKLLSSSKTSVINNQSTVYNFNKQNNVSIGPVWKNKVTLLLTAYFNKFFCLISKPVFTITPNKVKIHLFYYKPELESEEYKDLFWEIKNPGTVPETSKYISKGGFVRTKGLKVSKRTLISNLNSWRGHLLFLPNFRLKYLAVLLSKVLKTNVELELVRLKYPYHDSNILAQLIGMNGKTLTYGNIKSLLFSNATVHTKQTLSVKKAGAEEAEAENTTATVVADLNTTKEIASHLVGLKIRISGRLARQRVVPKRTVKTAYKGTVSTSKGNLVDSSTFTSKNRKGAFSVRVWLSHSPSINT